jgi:hypothetical protein
MKASMLAALTSTAGGGDWASARMPTANVSVAVRSRVRMATSGNAPAEGRPAASE